MMKPSTKDQVEGKLHEIKGEIKETVGEAKTDPNLAEVGTPAPAPCKGGVRPQDILYTPALAREPAQNLSFICPRDDSAEGIRTAGAITANSSGPRGYCSGAYE